MSLCLRVQGEEVQGEERVRQGAPLLALIVMLCRCASGCKEKRCKERRRIREVSHVLCLTSCCVGVLRGARKEEELDG